MDGKLGFSIQRSGKENEEVPVFSILVLYPSFVLANPIIGDISAVYSSNFLFFLPNTIPQTIALICGHSVDGVFRFFLIPTKITPRDTAIMVLTLMFEPLNRNQMAIFTLEGPRAIVVLGDGENLRGLSL